MLCVSSNGDTNIPDNLVFPLPLESGWPHAVSGEQLMVNHHVDTNAKLRFNHEWNSSLFSLQLLPHKTKERGWDLCVNLSKKIRNNIHLISSKLISDWIKSFNLFVPFFHHYSSYTKLKKGVKIPVWIRPTRNITLPISSTQKKVNK